MKYMKRSSNLNVLLVGASNSGKTSFVRTLAAAEVESEGEMAEHQISVNNSAIKIYDCRGYGREQDMQEKFASIDVFVRDGNKSFLQEEIKIERDPHFEDKRIHLMVLFSSPAYKGMKDHDITLLRMMNTKVNTLVVIPKCDYYTKEELGLQKRKIIDLLKSNNIDTFGVEEHEDATVYALFSAEKKMIDGALYAGRELPCGTAKVENSEHSDYLEFLKILEHSREDLVGITHTHFYEKYRTAMLK
ncbi:cell division control protein 11 [Nematocida minor]|uniref:cell division control protein 11 n=1 Tax=Nematocida minor TaxID=1912983 RepID=UPI002220CEA0|nr:cell division control protein 11 [Nematocida minor]KAI5190945.1 cell division control protein 11 [Nematocida minor]